MKVKTVRTDSPAVALACSKETIDEPRLACQFSSHPPKCVRNVGNGKANIKGQSSHLLDSRRPLIRWTLASIINAMKIIPIVTMR